MPVLTSAPISNLAVELLRRSLVLVGTVSRVPAPEYSGPSGGVVTLRVPTPRTANEQATAGSVITYSDLDEVPVAVTVRHFYDACRVSDEDLSMAITDFGRTVLLPQVAAVAERAEDEIAAAMNGLAADATIEWAAAPNVDADLATVLAARERLAIDGVPAGSRYLAVAPDIATRLLSVPMLVRADERGQTNALDEAIVGRIYGLTVVESAALDAGSAIAYHQSGFAFGSMPPVSPPGGVDSTTASDGGVSLRHLLAFDATRLATGSVVSVFAGASVVTDDEAGTTHNRAIRIDTGA